MEDTHLIVRSEVPLQNVKTRTRVYWDHSHMETDAKGIGDRNYNPLNTNLN